MSGFYDKYRGLFEDDRSGHYSSAQTKQFLNQPRQPLGFNPPQVPIPIPRQMPMPMQTQTQMRMSTPAQTQTQTHIPVPVPVQMQLAKHHVVDPYYPPPSCMPHMYEPPPGSSRYSRLVAEVAKNGSLDDYPQKRKTPLRDVYMHSVAKASQAYDQSYTSHQKASANHATSYIESQDHQLIDPMPTLLQEHTTPMYLELGVPSSASYREPFKQVVPISQHQPTKVSSPSSVCSLY